MARVVKQVSMFRSKKVIVEFYLLLWYTPFVISSYTLVHVALALRHGPFFIVSLAQHHPLSMGYVTSEKPHRQLRGRYSFLILAYPQTIHRFFVYV